MFARPLPLGIPTSAVGTEALPDNILGWTCRLGVEIDERWKTGFRGATIESDERVRRTKTTTELGRPVFGRG